MSIAVRAGRASATSHWDALALAYGLRFVARDVGNGVRRVLSAQLLPIDEAKSEALGAGRVMMVFPPPMWLVDLGFSALESMGIDVDRDNRARTPMIYARHIDDYTIELVFWRA